MTKSNNKLEEFYKAGKTSRPPVDNYRQVKVVVNKIEIDNNLASVLSIVLNYALSQIKSDLNITITEDTEKFEVIVEK